MVLQGQSNAKIACASQTRVLLDLVPSCAIPSLSSLTAAPLTAPVFLCLQQSLLLTPWAMHHMLGVFNFKELQDRWSLMELSCYPSSWSRGCSAIRWQRSCSDLLQAPQVSTNLGSISLQGCNKLYCLWLSYIPSSLDQNIISWQKKTWHKATFSSNHPQERICQSHTSLCNSLGDGVLL